ncbi:MAG: PP2C family protein-serine/threonine phosphatase [Janthinobacterium lividum]
MSHYRIEAATGQHIGDRSEQQDRAGVFTSANAPGYVLAVLADGMGGLSGGAMAAEQVLRTAQQLFEQFVPGTDDPEKMLETIGHESHMIINLSGMSSEKQPHSTMVALLLTPEHSAIWAHVGDSRLYRFSGPNFVERTYDHSLVEKLVGEGRVAPADAGAHRLAHVLMNVLGTSNTSIFVSINRHDQVRPGDGFLLCSDGLWHYFDEAELGAAITMGSPRETCEMLVRKSRERAAGSKSDNCTMIVARVFDVPEEKPRVKATPLRRAV